MDFSRTAWRETSAMGKSTSARRWQDLGIKVDGVGVKLDGEGDCAVRAVVNEHRGLQ